MIYRVLAILLFGLSCAQAQTIGLSFFGMNYGTPLTTPTPKIYSDNNRLYSACATHCVQWGTIETARGVFDWTSLDPIVAQSFAQGASIIYTFAFVPGWANGNSSGDVPPTSFQDFYDFVTAVVTRYKGKIKYYEVWNEMNCNGSCAAGMDGWSGTVAQMVTFAQNVFSIVHSIDPNALVLSPSVFGLSGETYMDSFLTLGGGAFADILNVHGYPLWGVPSQPPEQTQQIMQTYAAMFSFHGLGSLPVAVDEGYWGNEGAVTTIPAQNAYAAVYPLLLASSGAIFQNWYCFDCVGNGDLWNGATWLNPTGIAYRQMEQWLVGATFTSPATRQATTNQVRNPTASGATAGTQGACASTTLGTPPTDWTVFPTGLTNGVRSSVVGTGTENGVAYLDFRICGTPTSDGNVTLGFEGTTHITASNGQMWTPCVDTKLSGGSTTGVIMTLGYGEINSGGGFIDSPVSPQFNLFPYPLQTQPQCWSGVNISSSVAFVQPFVNLSYSSGVALDQTIRVGAPSMEVGGIWSATISRPGGYQGQIVWDASGGPTSYSVPITYSFFRDGFGNTGPVGSTINITNQPILLESTQWQGWLQ